MEVVGSIPAQDPDSFRLSGCRATCSIYPSPGRITPFHAFMYLYKINFFTNKPGEFGKVSRQVTL